MNRYRLVHITEFQYEGVVSESYNEVRLRPWQDEAQSCLSFKLTTTPASNPQAYLDFFSNWVHQFNILPEHNSLRVEAECVVLVHDPLETTSEGIPLAELPAMAEELNEQFYDLLAPSVYVPHAPELADLAAAAEAGSNGTTAGFVDAAVRVIHSRFRYEKGATHVNSSIEDSLKSRSGVCQDFSHLLLGVARAKGLPARYVSGYLVPKKAAEAGANNDEVVGGHSSHAWVEVYVPGLGWIGQDPTLGQRTNNRHVRVAYGRDYGDVPPVRGVYKGQAGQRLSVDVRVVPATDLEGHEHVDAPAAVTPAPATRPDAPQQQQQQQ